MKRKPFAITLDPGSSLANHTGSWRTVRPEYVDRLPPCNHACPAGENIQGWLFHAEAGEYEQALARFGIADRQVRDHILTQLTFLKFLNLRFHIAVQIADEDVEDYFKKAIEPAAKAAAGGLPVLLDDYRERIVEILTDRQVDRDLDAWIREGVKRTVVEYRPEVFKP